MDEYLVLEAGFPSGHGMCGRVSGGIGVKAWWVCWDDASASIPFLIVHGFGTQQTSLYRLQGLFSPSFPLPIPSSINISNLKRSEKHVHLERRWWSLVASSEPLVIYLSAPFRAPCQVCQVLGTTSEGRSRPFRCGQRGCSGNWKR